MFYSYIEVRRGCSWDLVTILPGAVYGPPLSDRSTGESVNQIKARASHQGQGLRLEKLAYCHCVAVRDWLAKKHSHLSTLRL